MNTGWSECSRQCWHSTLWASTRWTGSLASRHSGKQGSLSQWFWKSASLPILSSTGTFHFIYPGSTRQVFLCLHTYPVFVSVLPLCSLLLLLYCYYFCCSVRYVWSYMHQTGLKLAGPIHLPPMKFFSKLNYLFFWILWSCKYIFW